MLMLSIDFIAESKDPALEPFVEKARSWRQDEVKISGHDLTDAVLTAIEKLAIEKKNTGIRRQARAMLDARAGKTPSIPKINTAPEIIMSYLRANLIKGWVWIGDGGPRALPYLLTDIDVVYPVREPGPPSLIIKLSAESISESSTRSNKTRGASRSITLDPDDVRNKTVLQVLEKAGLTPETQELHDEYATVTEHYREIISTGFAKQFWFDGHWAERYSSGERRRSKVVHDVKTVAPFNEYAQSALFDDSHDADLPIHPLVNVFDLKSHDSNWVHVSDMTEYVWDDSLADKLILPDSQRELLNILTTDISVFASDIVAGKSAGNVILCKGIPGVGKTLSAEVYAEITHRPLYAIHSGNLGVSPDKIRESLETAFKRVQRWGAVLLLDEADVFILERGRDVVQNAIVAEFLRTLEYFDGLLFMTTNRPDDIDDAIISRCAAIIDYQPPTGDDAARVWRVLARNNELEISDQLITELLEHFPRIAPREIKMLLRLVLRVSLHREYDVDIELFRQCAIFRGLRYES